MDDNHNVFLKPPLWLPIVVAVLLGGSFIYGKHVESSPEPAMISVNGEGKVSASPDITQLNFGVATGRMPSAQAAMEELNTRMTAITAAVKAQNIEDKDISTQYLSLSPAYDWLDGRQVERGFEANQSLIVKVRDLEKISNVLDAAIENGANQAGGVSFTIDEPAELQAQARDEAIKDAEAKAKVLADQLGVRLGKLRSFSEGYNGGVPPMPYYTRAESMDAAVGMGGAVSNAALPTGEQEVQVTVSLTYEVK